MYESFSVASSERKYLHATTSLGPVDIRTSNASFTHTKIRVTRILTRPMSMTKFGCSMNYLPP